MKILESETTLKVALIPVVLLALVSALVPPIWLLAIGQVSLWLLGVSFLTLASPVIYLLIRASSWLNPEHHHSESSAFTYLVIIRAFYQMSILGIWCLFIFYCATVLLDFREQLIALSLFDLKTLSEIIFHSNLSELYHGAFNQINEHPGHTVPILLLSCFVCIGPIAFQAIWQSREGRDTTIVLHAFLLLAYTALLVAFYLNLLTAFNTALTLMISAFIIMILQILDDFEI